MRLFVVKIPFENLANEEYERLLSHLDKNSRDRIRRYRLRDDAVRSAVGRLLPIWYLRIHLSVSGSLKHQTGPHGKPFIIYDGKTLEYNVSHHGPYVLIGVTDAPGASVGVDVTFVPSEADYPALEESLQEALSPNERQALHSSISPTRERMLAMIWAAKEAYVKALGEGVTFGLQRIDVHVDNECLAATIRVDGTNIKAEHWTWSSGWLEHRQCAWVAIGRGQAIHQALTPEHLPWTGMCADLANSLRDHKG